MIFDYNNTPLPECNGFTPLQMRKITHNPFDEDCPVKINMLNKEVLLQKCPIMKIVTELLLILKTNKIKLTQKGNLPLKIIRDIYSKNYLPDRWIEKEIVKIRTETDWLIIHNAKIVLTIAGFIRKKYNHLHLTKKCEALLNSESYSEIFYEFLKTFSLNFNWSYNDIYEDEILGQLGFLYSMHLINKYGKEKRDLKFYTDLYLLAYPGFVEYNRDNYSRKKSVYYTRFIERFAMWFGFVEEEIIEGKSYWDSEVKIKRTELLEQLLQT